MPLRNVGRWAAPGFALSLLLLGGCRWLPLRRPAATLDPRQVSAAPDLELVRPAPILPDAGPTTTARAHVPLPPLPLRAVSDAEALAANPAAPTPNLDAALVRAREIEAITLSEFDEPEPQPFPPPGELNVPEVAAQAPKPAPKVRDEAVRVTVYTAGSTPPEPPAAEPAPAATPEVTWRTGLDALLALARDHARFEPDPAGLWAAREQVLRRLVETGDGDPSTIEPDLVLWQTLLATLAKAESRETAEPVSPTPPAPEEPELAIVGLCVCRRVDGFGLYEPADPAPLKAGQTITLYWEVEGLHAESDGTYYRTRLASSVAILPAEGGSDDAKPLWTRSLGTADDTCRRRRRDYFVNGRLTLPESLPPGPFRLRLTLDDRISGQSTSQMLTLTTQP